MHRAPTVAAEVWMALLARAAASGIAPEVIQAQLAAGVPTVDEQGRVPAAPVRALWTALPVLCGDPSLGLNLARGAPDRALGMVGSAIVHAPTLGDGLRVAVRFARILQDVAFCWLEPLDGGLRFIQAPPLDGPAPPRHAVEFAFARTVLMARRSTGVALAPAAVRFAFPRPEDTAPHRALFGCPLEFGHLRNELDFDAATVQLEQHTADRPQLEWVERRARALLEGLGPQPVAARVAALLGAGFPSGEPSLAAVAKGLALSERTLQRRLREEARPFRRLVDETRKVLAHHYLGEPEHSLAQITAMLGFSEQAAFQRAFRRWTGVTPAQHRRTLAPRVNTGEGRTVIVG